MMKFRDAILRMIISIIASLPFGVLYFVSDILAFVLQHIFRYRISIVYENLEKSFPGKDKAEIKRIAARYYRNLADLTMEILKSSKMTAAQLESRVVFRNKEIFDELYSSGKNVFATLGHCGNWEWTGNKIALFLQHDGAAIYKPLQDKFFDQYMIGLRQKYKGTLMIDYKKVFRTLLSLKDKLFTVFVLADQSPAKTEIDHYEMFLGQKTPFFNGMEKVAKALNFTVLYLDVRRSRRGYYDVEVHVITSDASATTDGFITAKYAEMLEGTIRRQPDNWLWSHRRWKQKEEKTN